MSSHVKFEASLEGKLHVENSSVQFSSVQFSSVQKHRIILLLQVKCVLSPELQECMDRNEGGAATSTRGRGETAITQR